MARDFRKVTAWRLADDLAVRVYQITARFPRHEMYGLTQQLRRAAVSVASNIAQGAARESKVEYLRFCDIARGSLADTRYQLHLARRLEYMTPADHAALEAQAEEVAKALHGLITAIRSEV